MKRNLCLVLSKIIFSFLNFLFQFFNELCVYLINEKQYLFKLTVVRPRIVFGLQHYVYFVIVDNPFCIYMFNLLQTLSYNLGEIKRMALTKVMRSGYGYSYRQNRSVFACSCSLSLKSALYNDEPRISPDDIKPFSKMPGPKGVYDIPYLGALFLFKPFCK